MDPDGRLAAKAAALIDQDCERIARAVTRQIQRTVPRYSEVDPHALTKNNAALLGCVGEVLIHNRVQKFTDLVEGMAVLRAAAGFGVGDFMVGAMCFFPVLRRFLVTRANNVAEGLVMFEILEGILLPMVGRTAEIYIACLVEDPDSTDPTLKGFDRSRFASMLSESLSDTAPSFTPIPIASVEEGGYEFAAFDDDGDDTSPGLR